MFSKGSVGVEILIPGGGGLGRGLNGGLNEKKSSRLAIARHDPPTTQPLIFTLVQLILAHRSGVRVIFLCCAKFRVNRNRPPICDSLILSTVSAVSQKRANFGKLYFRQAWTGLILIIFLVNSISKLLKM